MSETKHPLVTVLGSATDSAAQLCRNNPVIDAPTQLENITVVPVNQVSVGIAGGASDGKSKGNSPAATGVGVSRTPLSLIVIKDGKVEVISATPNSTKQALKDTVSKGKALWGKLKSLKKRK